MSKAKDFLRKSVLFAKRKTLGTLKKFPAFVNSKAFQNSIASSYFRNVNHHPDSYHETSGERRIAYFHGSKSEQIAEMLSMIRIRIEPGKKFQCWIDEGLYTPVINRMIENLSPNYELVIANSLNGLISRYEAMNNTVARNNVTILRAVCSYADKIADELDSSGLTQSAEIFRNMKDSPAKNFEEALQRILLWSSIFWQSHHRLVGLGRLDKILSPFIEPGKSQERIELIHGFCEALHRHYGFKSNGIAKGDTGQIIILGGVEPDGKYFANDLTYDFINAFIQRGVPDPKLLLRVSANMPGEILRLAVDCIASGIGCPLLCDDDVVVPALEDFGYSHDDACNYVVSACWEPLAYGKSLEQNNIGSINFAQVIADVYRDKNFASLKDFDSLVEMYKSKLKLHILKVLRGLNAVRWEEEPLFSLFTEGCIESGKDMSQGGAVYNDYGVTAVGMSNTVNSLLNIKFTIFEDRKFTAEALRDAAINNYPDESIRAFLDGHKYFGRDEDDVISLTNEITGFTAGLVEGYRNPFGGRVKFGLSSPNYIEAGRFTPATLDGRKSGEPLGVHISNPKGVPYTELVMFASSLKYSGVRSNGNVLDYFVSPAILHDEREKFYDFTKSAVKAGFFQMQMNVVDSAKLIDAKKHPGKYPDLIVRVWGFSAYFDELPEEYKDVLIERALSAESKSA